MKRTLLIGAGLLLTAMSSQARDPSCGPIHSKTIESKASCADQGGVPTGLSPDESSTFTCLENRTVQNRCGPDGNLVRLRAYQTWLKKMKEFEAGCTSKGGTFSFEDPAFREPTDESFCLRAAPELSSNMFEETLCNFHSACPAVNVRCEQTCTETTTLALID